MDRQPDWIAAGTQDAALLPTLWLERPVDLTLRFDPLASVLRD